MIVGCWKFFKAALSIDVISIVALEGYNHMIRCLYAVFGYKYFLATINYFRRLYTTFGGYILLSTAFGGYTLLLTAIHYFRRLNTTFSFTFCNFERIQDFPAICALKAGLEFNINLLALIQF